MRQTQQQKQQGTFGEKESRIYNECEWIALNDERMRMAMAMGMGMEMVMGMGMRVWQTGSPGLLSSSARISLPWPIHVEIECGLWH